MPLVTVLLVVNVRLRLQKSDPNRVSWAAPESAVGFGEPQADSNKYLMMVLTPPADIQDADTGFPSIFDPSTCVRKGLCPVSQARNASNPLESHSLYYEQHGNGPEKIVFIMGRVISPKLLPQ
jgi:hypothetical protein